MLTLFIYIYYGSVINIEVVSGLDHAIVVWIVPSCYSDSANSVHLHRVDEVRINPYDYPLQWKVLKHFIYKMEV